MGDASTNLQFPCQVEALHLSQHLLARTYTASTQQYPELTASLLVMNPRVTLIVN